MQTKPEIPEGWLEFTSGTAFLGCKYLVRTNECTRWEWVDRELVGLEAEEFDCLIRPERNDQ